MKTETDLSKSQSFVEKMESLKEAIRNWYGSISIEELVSNRMLIKEIEELKVLLAQAGVLL